MTVAAKPATASYVEDGVSISFPVPFRFKAATDLIVERLLDAGGVTTLTIGTDYSVSGGLTDAGGELKRTVATSGATLRIRRQTARAQPMVYATGDRFPAKSHEETVDRGILISQEQDDTIDDTRARALMVPAGQAVGEIVPAPNSALVFDEAGNPASKPIGSFPPGPPGGNVMSVDPFTVMRDTSAIVPAGTDRVRTSAFTTTQVPFANVGGADYIADPAVTDDYAAANPLTTFRASDEEGNVRGFRLEEPVLTPQMLGAKDDGSASIHQVLLALSGTDKPMAVPNGTYLVDNSDPRQINFYSGEISFASGARLVFTDQTRIGLFFYKGSPKVRGVTLTTRDVPTIRQNNAAMLRFDDTVEAICSDVVIPRGAGAGVLVLRGTGFRGNNIAIGNTLADGFDFFNHQNGSLDNLLTVGTGDDGLGNVSYADGPQGRNLTLSNINIFKSDTRGISFVGYQNVVLNGFLVEETQGDGLIVERDDTAVTHTPTAVRLMNGNILRAGQRVVDAEYTGEKHGLKIGQSGTVDVIGVTIVNAKSRGLSATSSELNAHLFTDGVRVENAGDEGFFVYNHRSWTYGTITTLDTRVEGVRTLAVDRLIGGKRIVIRASKGGGGFRAIWDANNQFQDPGEAVIEDLTGPATGFIYRVEGNGRGSAGTVQWNQSGAFYNEVVAPYLTIPPRQAAKRDDVSPGAGDIILSPNDAWDRKIYAALAGDIVVGLPTFGMVHGDEVSLSRYDGSGTATVSFQDRGKDNVVVTTIPPGTPMIARVWWDATSNRWRSRGKNNL